MTTKNVGYTVGGPLIAENHAPQSTMGIFDAINVVLFVVITETPLKKQKTKQILAFYTLHMLFNLLYTIYHNYSHYSQLHKTF